MKILICFSGGKDSQASLIWAVKKYGKDNCTAVFCDTLWESDITYKHINKTCQELGVGLVVLVNEKYNGFLNLCKTKKRFPSVKARFCTEELKVKPLIDFVLSINDHVLIIQGIRKDESSSRSKLESTCRFFKNYFYKNLNNGRLYSYRKKEVLKWCLNFTDDIIRPVFHWSAQDVIDYIIDNGFQPNELYKLGFKRVGCFPCILSGHQEVKSLIDSFPERFKFIVDSENELKSSYFKIDFVPEREKTGVCHKTGKKFTKADDIYKYLKDKNQTLDIFKNDSEISCSSYYNLCE